MKNYYFLFKYSKDENSWILTKKQIIANTQEKAILKLKSMYSFIKEIKIVEDIDD